MPILNYTTTIAASKTVMEIQDTLAAHGAEEISVSYDSVGQARVPVALVFSIQVGANLVAFRLPCKWQGVLVALRRDPKVQPRYRTNEQALKVAWRIIKDWVEAQLALIQAGQAELAEIFLPYAVGQDGSTFYEQFKARQGLLPPPQEGR